MPENEPKKAGPSEGAKREPAKEKPLIFISHDSRDAELAEALSKLLTNVSAGVLKSFRSSDKKGRQGIEYGVEWYPKLMEQLENASDVVCLLTQRSVDRPWILYEAGVAKGKLDKPVYGIALGIALSNASTGPFAQFQNCDDDEESLTKLVMQLVERIPGSEPDHDAVLMQVKAFKERASELLTKLGGDDSTDEQQPDTSAIAKMFEEVKIMFKDLPTRVESALADADRPSRRTRPFRFHPMMVEEMTHMAGGRGRNSAIAMLVLAGFLRDDFPWLYEIAMEAYRGLKSGDTKVAREAVRTLQRAAEFTMHGPMMEEFGPRDRESHMMLMELPRFIEHITRRFMPPSKEEGDAESQ